MKVHIVYYKKSIYGFTDNIEIYKSFISERNMNVFECKTVKMTKSEYKILSDKYFDKELTSTPLHDGYNYYYIISNNYEENKLNIFIDNLENRLREVSIILSEVNFKNKYRELIESLSDIIEIVPREDEYIYDKYLSINQVLLFYKLFKFSFT